VREIAEPALDVVEREVRPQHANAAVDVVADSARRDHPLVGIECRDSADREPVTLMGVRHREGVLPDARQGGDIDQLLERTVTQDVVEHPLAGVEARWNTHVVPIPLRDLPQGVGAARDGFTVQHV
jgi:hypothetical protein